MSHTFPHPLYSRTVLIPAYDDAQAYLFGPMTDAHEAHTVMLAEAGIISAENAKAILQAVAEIRADGPDALAYQPGVEDLFFRMETAIIQRTGPDFGGNLQLARSRNDLGHALARQALRLTILDLHSDLLALRQAVLDLAAAHTETLMPGYTHTQPAQPITFAHYLAGVLSFLAKDNIRIAQAYANMNESPLGAAAFTGTGFDIDRGRVAELLGYDTVIPSTQHCIGAGDHLTDTAFAVQSLAIGLGRVTKDLLFLATQESGALHIHDSFIQISSIMPQKRNPVVLEHLRARLSRAVGYAQTVVIQCHSIPYGDTQDIEDEILPPIYAALHTMRECVQLYTSVFDTLTLNGDHLRQRAGEGFTTATELADALVREAGLPFRTAHKIVSTLVKSAVAAGKGSTELDFPMLQAAMQTVLGRAIDFSVAQFAAALDPVAFVSARKGLGGVAPAATGAVLDTQSAAVEADAAWLLSTQNRLAAAQIARQQAVAAYLKVS
ncbi:MAG: argininosuccinate lyase [Caldilineaceae bacterium]|nr:argininosuccinate lyase [Caldilineaceae bacterium]MBP8106782.1 argininosuccinate lyase [Caldilineaceae bacterium]MBP8120990.1 argininosuccinate lyase [Caldilineaceae bacterium]MBP9071795.1 argininosuccinate lyase [Caldilineaceae bacterium]